MNLGYSITSTSSSKSFISMSVKLKPISLTILAGVWVLDYNFTIVNQYNETGWLTYGITNDPLNFQVHEIIKLNTEQVISNNKIQGTRVITSTTSTIYYLMMVVNNFIDLRSNDISCSSSNMTITRIA